ncbi:LysR family transcriptional regulator [Thaumasiovibrio subtropicus]|uniref:LysR family transcriptional regulator n=1 Tax=Thaumasiovibrio subtropicus TaxID=1891207 RepID=UPI00131B137D|nr:LysR family transcriptional regulator [Thaumasiovibrio subtropicus]
MLNSFQFEHINYFVTVVELQSITKAAKKLGRDRSTISVAISNLEADLNITLFERHGRTIGLTDAGESLYRQARSLVRHYNNFYHYSLSIQADIESELNLYCDAFISTNEMCKIDAVVADRFPHTQLNWHSLQGDQHHQHFQRDPSGLGLRLFLNLDAPESMQFKHLTEKKLVAVVGKAQAEKSGLKEAEKFDDFRTRALIAIPELENAIRLDRIERVQRVTSIEQAIALIQQKPCWALLPLPAVSAFLASGQLIQVHLDAIPDFALKRVLSWQNSVDMGQVKRWLIDNLSDLI